MKADINLVSDEVAGKFIDARSLKITCWVYSKDLEKVVSDLLKQNEWKTTDKVETLEQEELEEKVLWLKVMKHHLSIHNEDIEEMKELRFDL